MRRGVHYLQGTTQPISLLTWWKRDCPHCWGYLLRGWALTPPCWKGDSLEIPSCARCSILNYFFLPPNCFLSLLSGEQSRQTARKGSWVSPLLQFPGGEAEVLTQQGPYMLSGALHHIGLSAGTVILLTILRWDPFVRGIQFTEIGELKETSWIQVQY